MKIAQKADGVKIDDEGNVEKIIGNGRNALEEVVYSYAEKVGSISVTMIAKELHERDIQLTDIPDILEEKM